MRFGHIGRCDDAQERAPQLTAEFEHLLGNLKRALKLAHLLEQQSDIAERPCLGHLVPILAGVQEIAVVTGEGPAVVAAPVGVGPQPIDGPILQIRLACLGGELLRLLEKCVALVHLLEQAERNPLDPEARGQRRGDAQALRLFECRTGERQGLARIGCDQLLGAHILLLQTRQRISRSRSGAGHGSFLRAKAA